MASQMLIIDGDSLVKLLTAYFNGDVPLDARLKSIGVSQFLQNYIGLTLDSDQWGTDTLIGNGVEGHHPLILRYEGRHNLSWSKGDKVENPTWGLQGEDFEIPHG